MDIADAGGEIGVESMPIMDQPEPGYSPFMFTPPVVNVGTSITKLATDLMSTQIWSVSEANARWKSLGSEVREIVSGLEKAAGSLENENDSETTSRAAAKIREVAASGKHFVANAEAMGEKLTGFHSRLMMIQPSAMAMAMDIMKISDPAERKIAETAALAKLQPDLQRFAIDAMPNQHALMEQSPASGGGGIDAGLSGVDGDGQKYRTDSVAWPRAIQEAIARGDVGPGNFDVANGTVHDLESVGMTPEETAAFQEQLHADGRKALSQLGVGDGMDISGRDVATSGASLPGTTAPHSQLGSTSMAGGGPGATGMGTGAGLGPGTGIASATGTPTFGGRAGSGNPGALRGGGFNPTAGLGSGALGTGGRPGSGVGGNMGALVNSAPGLGADGTAARGGAALRGGSGESVGARGVGGALPRGAGESAGNSSGGNGNRGHLERGAVREAVVRGGGAINSTGAKSGAARPAAGMRAFAPMMGTRGQGNDKNRVKAVTTQVERDPNKRDLLGEPPAVVPGVIGNWARES
ncbi:hypothetical protein [Corynebacterium sp. KPL2838]|uniref:hypothetical protein n=1 Tax=Corynebacterium sp. KPL2838 TaxID=3158316 RepID=UPI0032EC5B71